MVVSIGWWTKSLHGKWVEIRVPEPKFLTYWPLVSQIAAGFQELLELPAMKNVKLDPKFLGLKNEKRLLKLPPHLRKHTGHATKNNMSAFPQPPSTSPPVIPAIPKPPPNHQTWRGMLKQLLGTLRNGTAGLLRTKNEKNTRSFGKKTTFHESSWLFHRGSHYLHGKPYMSGGGGFLPSTGFLTLVV